MWDWDTMSSTQGQCQGCPLDARMLKRRPPGEGAMPNRTEIWLLKGVNAADEMDWNFHWTIPAPWPIISTWIHSSGPLLPCAGTQKTPCSGLEVAMFREAAKRERRGDNLTCKQNSSKAVRKYWSGQDDLDCHRRCCHAWRNYLRPGLYKVFQKSWTDFLGWYLWTFKAYNNQ